MKAEDIELSLVGNEIVEIGMGPPVGEKKQGRKHR